MPWKVIDLMSQRYEFCHLARLPRANISSLCRVCGISRQTGYKWLKRYAEGQARSLADRSRRPHHSPNRTDAGIEAQVIALRQAYAYWGPRKIRRLLQDRLTPQQLPALVTVARILKRHGLILPQPPPSPVVDLQRFARPHPNDLWQMDLCSHLYLKGGNKIYPLALIDDHSRYLLGLWMLPDQTDDRVLSCWIRAVQSYGLPQQTLTDHGSQFGTANDATSAFRVYLWACGVDHIQGRVAHPQTQGKVERFWGTLKREVMTRHRYGDLGSWQACLDEWRHQYNHLRPHQELGDEVPASRYRPSPIPYVAPDRHQYVGQPESLYRHVNAKGQVLLGGQYLTVGRGLAGWKVEARPGQGGYWRIYFRDHFIGEYYLAKPVWVSNSRRAKWGKSTTCPTSQDQDLP